MKFKHLTKENRTIIEYLVKKKKSCSEIARELGVHRSTVLRELKRNSSLENNYTSMGAQRFTNQRIKNIQVFKRKIKGPIAECVRMKIKDGWSPEQIAARLKLEGKWSISHESIYKYVHFIDPDLKRYLRRAGRRKRKNPYHRHRIIPHWMPKKFIDLRPIEAEQKKEFGHFERDLLMGKQAGPALLVIQDRKSLYTLLIKVKNKKCSEVSQKTIRALKPFKVLTLTNDNGCEFGGFIKTEEKLKAPIYFCHPYSSQERGSIENTNGLLRQFFPKGINFNTVSNKTIGLVQEMINKRPRRILNYKSPNEIFLNESEKYINSYSYYYKNMIERYCEEQEMYLEQFN